eukprot:1154540-Pelagomonas_calceolata.AAC.2
MTTKLRALAHIRVLRTATRAPPRQAPRSKAQPRESSVPPHSVGHEHHRIDNTGITFQAT